MQLEKVRRYSDYSVGSIFKYCTKIIQTFSIGGCRHACRRAIPGIRCRKELGRRPHVFLALVLSLPALLRNKTRKNIAKKENERIGVFSGNAGKAEASLGVQNDSRNEATDLQAYKDIHMILYVK